MSPFSIARRTILILGLALTPVAASGQAAPAGPLSEGAAAGGVRCPAEYEALFDASSKVLRCRRDVVSWVVTSCGERSFSTYVAKAGADSCAPTEIPGVGSPPGATGSRPVVCVSAGYSVVVDRTGLRDRCERVERLFAFPRPAEGDR